MSDNTGQTYFDGVKMSKRQKHFMIFLIAGTFLEQIDLYNFALLSPVLMQVWEISLGDVGKIQGIFGLGATLGALFFEWIADKKGRRIAMGCCLLAAGVASVVAALAPNLNVLLIARFVSGFGITGAVLVEPIYLVEMVPSDKRSRFQDLLALVALTGIPISATIAKLLFSIDPAYWRIVAAIPSIALVIGIAFFLMVPESPRWLVSVGRQAEAEKTFLHITGHTLRVDPNAKCVVEKTTYGEALKVMFSHKNLKRTMMNLGIFVFLVPTGYMFSQWMPTL